VITRLVGDAIGAGTAALVRETAALQPFVTATSAAASSGVVEGALRHDRAVVGLIEQGSGAASRAFTREAIAELLAQLEERAGGGAEAELEGRASLLARRTAAAAVAGAAEQVGAELAACSEDDPRCATAVIERISRAAGRGAAGGIRKELSLWPFALAFALGLLIAAPAGWALRSAAGRRAAPPAP
jgi:hypothetical protein